MGEIIAGFIPERTNLLAVRDNNKNGRLEANELGRAGYAEIAFELTQALLKKKITRSEAGQYLLNNKISTEKAARVLSQMTIRESLIIFEEILAANRDKTFKIYQEILRANNGFRPLQLFLFLAVSGADEPPDFYRYLYRNYPARAAAINNTDEMMKLLKGYPARVIAEILMEIPESSAGNWFKSLAYQDRRRALEILARFEPARSEELARLRQLLTGVSESEKKFLLEALEKKIGIDWELTPGTDPFEKR